MQGKKRSKCDAGERSGDGPGVVEIATAQGSPHGFQGLMEEYTAATGSPGLFHPTRDTRLMDFAGGMG